MTGNGDFFAYIGAFVLWALKGFKRKYMDIVEDHYFISFIVGFIFVVLAILLYEYLFNIKL